MFVQTVLNNVLTVQVEDKLVRKTLCKGEDGSGGVGHVLRMCSNLLPCLYYHSVMLITPDLLSYMKFPFFFGDIKALMGPFLLRSPCLTIHIHQL